MGEGKGGTVIISSWKCNYSIWKFGNVFLNSLTIWNVKKNWTDGRDRIPLSGSSELLGGWGGGLFYDEVGVNCWNFLTVRNAIFLAFFVLFYSCRSDVKLWRIFFLLFKFYSWFGIVYVWFDINNIIQYIWLYYSIITTFISTCERGMGH